MSEAMEMNVKIFYDKKKARSEAHYKINKILGLTGGFISFIIMVIMIVCFSQLHPISNSFIGLCLLCAILIGLFLFYFGVLYYPRGSDFVFVLRDGQLYCWHENMLNLYYIMKQKDDRFIHSINDNIVSLNDMKTNGMIDTITMVSNKKRYDFCIQYSIDYLKNAGLDIRECGPVTIKITPNYTNYVELIALLKKLLTI